MTVVARTELAAPPASTSPPTVLARFVHLTDMHIMDVRSPLRFEWIELLADDPYWKPLLHMHRPYECLAGHALAAHVDVIRQSGVNGSPTDLVLSTGDNIDNGQQNELDAYLALVMGGTAHLPADGGVLDARGEREWPYWSPDRTVADKWKARGFPAVDDFFARVAEPIVSRGLGAPFASLLGNHDLMVQGTSLFTPELERLLSAEGKAITPLAGFRPDDPHQRFLADAAAFIGAGERSIEADAGRVALDRSAWLRSHIAAGSVGYSDAHVATGSGDTVIDLEHVRIVILDTNHPYGDYQGSIGVAQLAWLDERLREVDAEPGRVAIVASHHGTAALVNERGGDDDRRLAAAFAAVVERHSCVVAWLVGHRHINRVSPRRGHSGHGHSGHGHWEITTSSTIDWPSEHRTIEVLRHGDGTIEIATTMRSHGAPAGSLPALHLELAQLFEGSTVTAWRSGEPHDRDTRLFVRR
jgi:metallophosphoesterase (TIGR03767 family)